MGKITATTIDLKDARSVTIREATIDDAPQVMALAQYVATHFSQYHVDTIGEFREEVSYWEKLIARHEERSGSLFLIAVCDAEVIAACDFSAMRQQRLSHWGAFAINVRSDFQGLGVGRLLLDTLLEWARRHPTLEIVTLKVHANNLRAIALYESLGFVKTGSLPQAVKYSDGSYVDAIEMYLSVKESNV